MLAATVLVTIRGPFRTVDMELPGDVLIGELVPILLEICGIAKNDPQAWYQASASLWVAGASAPLPNVFPCSIGIRPRVKSMKYCTS